MVTTSNLHKKGFSLIEISIIIVIISFLIVGVSGGKSLIDNAKLNTAISDLYALDQAIITFTQIYEQLPGDIDNATSLWSSTSNGNGNKSISCNNTGDECWKVWQHLDYNRSDLIKGVYNGTNEAPEHLANNMLQMQNMYHTSGILGYDGKLVYFSWASINAKNAYLIDEKIDDAIPNKGKFYIIPNWSTYNDCMYESDGTTIAGNSYTSGNGIYNLSVETKGCHPRYVSSYLEL